MVADRDIPGRYSQGSRTYAPGPLRVASLSLRHSRWPDISKPLSQLGLKGRQEDAHEFLRVAWRVLGCRFLHLGARAYAAAKMCRSADACRLCGGRHSCRD